jgi:hypothetical protein
MSFREGEEFVKNIKFKNIKNPPRRRIFYSDNVLIFSFCHQILKTLPNKLATVIGQTHHGTGLIA